MEEKSQIILFDGICNLCNGFVDFVIRHDSNERFIFGAIQSEKGQKYLDKLGMENNLETVIYLEDDIIYTESTAALKIIKKLNGLWPLLYIFIITPPFVRDGIYRWIARNRYAWFGKRRTCRMPDEAIRSRFL